MLKPLFALIFAFSFISTLAQVELEFARPKGVTAPPGVLRETRNVLQQRLEHFLAPGQKFNVIPRAGTILVRLESSDAVDVDAIIQLCITTGKLEFMDSEVALESGEAYAGSGRVIFTDKDILKATASTSEFGGAVVELELSPQGSDRLATYSKNNLGNFLVIVKDGSVLSSPLIQSEIPNGQVWIQSNFTLEEAQRLAAELTGRLPVALELVRQN